MQECANLGEKLSPGRWPADDQRVSGEEAMSGFIPAQQSVYSSTTVGCHGSTLNQHQMQQNQACSNDSPGSASPTVNLLLLFPGLLQASRFTVANSAKP